MKYCFLFLTILIFSCKNFNKNKANQIIPFTVNYKNNCIHNDTIKILDTIISNKKIKIIYTWNGDSCKIQSNKSSFFTLYLFIDKSFDSIQYKLCTDLSIGDSLLNTYEYLNYWATLNSFYILNKKNKLLKTNLFISENLMLFSLPFTSPYQITHNCNSILFATIEKKSVNIKKEILLYEEDFFIFEKEYLIGIPYAHAINRMEMELFRFDRKFNIYNCHRYFNCLQYDIYINDKNLYNYKKFTHELFNEYKKINTICKTCNDLYIIDSTFYRKL